MRNARAFLLVVFVFTVAAPSAASDYPAAKWRSWLENSGDRFPSESWLQYATPEEAGWSSEKLAEAGVYATRWAGDETRHRHWAGLASPLPAVAESVPGPPLRWPSPLPSAEADRGRSARGLSQVCRVSQCPLKTQPTPRSRKRLKSW